MTFEAIAGIVMPHVLNSGGDRIPSIDILPPGMGYLIHWDSSRGDRDPKYRLVGNTPFLLTLAGEVRGTWPYEFDHIPTTKLRVTRSEVVRPIPKRKNHGPGFYD